ncbi:1-aminocyclopropane-1-carboxylate deaminase/D-cysteine desulfhydrase [Adhaeribacter sp. BT258]|uniref:1-aminocyclopropane-1-carboxylate deaminase/D-cysteine desulfhydrase n=1 Tax=Adhaeribacter terrigena TaxID=2793070 RepID=A0ABS1C586_9BACT|nr:pyridoxal-phosphate dependent enzyme [Adhaeribacter terrigena]MBK0404361.1 1-aminocyclopropane-1-carboxylate deaminase/D-cysteine desulfhydrase [Adhaeribacter terrigena]
MTVSAQVLSDFFRRTPPVPVQKLESELLHGKQIELYVRREDLLHPDVSGNKWRKLKHNLLAAAEQHFETLLTFGGAFSNHIAAVAAAGKLFGFKTIGLIRGEEHLPLNHTLQQATENGMQLHYQDRETYRRKNEPDLQARLKQQFGHAYLIPEGGTNALALKGCTEIISEIKVDFDVLCCAAGTGGTAAGLLCGLNGSKALLAFSALKGDFLQQEIDAFTQICSGRTYRNWHLQTAYHFGGYAKTKPELFAFIQEFEQQFQIPLEPVYTAKMFFGLFELIRQNHFPAGTKIMALHTGGLQGNAGFKKEFNF